MATLLGILQVLTTAYSIQQLRDYRFSNIPTFILSITCFRLYILCFNHILFVSSCIFLGLSCILFASSGIFLSHATISPLFVMRFRRCILCQSIYSLSFASSCVFFVVCFKQHILYCVLQIVYPLLHSSSRIFSVACFKSSILYCILQAAYSLSYALSGILLSSASSGVFSVMLMLYMLPTCLCCIFCYI